MLVIKIILLVTLGLIFIQDFKSREVWFFLLPLFAIAGGSGFYNEVTTEVFVYSVAINICLVAILFIINYLFARFILKKDFFKEAMGAGDLLFIVAFAVSFPTISFVTFFVFSLLFSLAISFIFKLPFWKGNTIGFANYHNVPLAGYMALFLIAVYSSYWLGINHSIYLI